MSIQATEDPDTLKEIYTNKNTYDIGRSILLPSFIFVSKVINNGMSLENTEDPDTLKEIYTNKNTFDIGRSILLSSIIFVS